MAIANKYRLRVSANITRGRDTAPAMSNKVKENIMHKLVSTLDSLADLNIQINKDQNKK